MDREEARKRLRQIIDARLDECDPLAAFRKRAQRCRQAAPSGVPELRGCLAGLRVMADLIARNGGVAAGSSAAALRPGVLGWPVHAEVKSTALGAQGDPVGALRRSTGKFDILGGRFAHRREFRTEAMPTSGGLALTNSEFGLRVAQGNSLVTPTSDFRISRYGP